MADQIERGLAGAGELGGRAYRGQIAAATDRGHGIAPTVVRVVEDTLGKDPGRPGQPAPYRLLTTILDPPGARRRAGRAGSPALGA